MLKHNPRPRLHRIIRELYFLLRNPIVQVYWRCCKPHGVGVKCFIFNQDKLLLLKIGYAHKGWVLPGGAVDRGEQPLEAVKRELEEEAGIKNIDLEFIQTGIRHKGSGKVTLYYYLGYTQDETITIDDQEIVDGGWFDLMNLPPKRRKILNEEIEMIKNWKHERNQ